MNISLDIPADRRRRNARAMSLLVVVLAAGFFSMLLGEEVPTFGQRAPSTAQLAPTD